MCVRVCIPAYQEDDSVMEFDETPVGFFQEYENKILETLLELDQQPMEWEEKKPLKMLRKRKILRPNKRNKKTSVKKKENVEKIECVIKPQLEIKSETRVEPKIVPDYKDGTIQGTAQPSGGDVECRDKFDVDGFTIEIGEGVNLERKSIAKYITQPLSEYDVKIVNLGTVRPIRTLLDMLQASETEQENCYEITENSCHCLQMTKLSHERDCAICVFWSQNGYHEMYGSQHKEKRFYVIIVLEIDDMRCYYLLSVKTNSCFNVYKYNVASIFAEATIFPPPGLKAFIHVPCKGPEFDNCVTMLCTGEDFVDVIETSHVVLKDNDH